MASNAQIEQVNELLDTMDLFTALEADNIKWTVRDYLEKFRSLVIEDYMHGDGDAGIEAMDKLEEVLQLK